MIWTHYESDLSLALPLQRDHILAHLTHMTSVDRIVIEGNIGVDAVPREDGDQGDSRYYKAWLHGNPALVMRTEHLQRARLDIWLSPVAEAAWRYHVEGDTSQGPPRRRAKVFSTGEEIAPYVVLGVRIRRWNASQDLPKRLVNARIEDPDGIAFLGGLGKRRWKPIAQPLVAEMVKDALRPVPETTSTHRYAIAPLGEGQMIRYGKDGPVWIDAEGVVHLAGLAGYPQEAGPDREDGCWHRLTDVAEDHGLSGNPEDHEHRTRLTETITYDAVAQEVGQNELRRAFPDMRWGRGQTSGDRLRDRRDARYCRALFDRHPAIVIDIGSRREMWLSTNSVSSLINGGDGAPEDPDHSEASSLEGVDEERDQAAIAALEAALAETSRRKIKIVLQKGRLKARRMGTGATDDRIVDLMPGLPPIPSVE